MSPRLLLTDHPGSVHSETTPEPATFRSTCKRSFDYLFSFHSLPHSFAQSRHCNPFLTNHLGTLSRAIGGGARLKSTFCVLPFLLSPLECAVPRSRMLSALECAVTRTRSCNSFRMRSSEKRWGVWAALFPPRTLQALA